MQRPSTGDGCLHASERNAMPQPGYPVCGNRGNLERLLPKVYAVGLVN